MRQQNWVENILRPTVLTIERHTGNIICRKTRRAPAEMEQMMLYIKPFLSTDVTDREIYDLLRANNRLARAGGAETTYRTVQNIINKARKNFGIYNPRGKYADMNVPSGGRE